MASAGNSAEAAAIEAAYAEQVQALYKQLATGLVDASMDEQKSVQRFAAGLKIAKRARDLALNTIGATIPAVGSVTRGKRGRKRAGA